MTAERRGARTASELGTVKKTINVHRARVMEKVGARSLAELARMAQRIGLAVPPAGR